MVVKFQLTPGASGSNSAATSIGIGPPSLLAIVIRPSTSAAWYTVLKKCTVAYVSCSTQVPSYWFRFHHHFLIWIDQVSHKKSPVSVVAKESWLDIERGMWWLNSDGHDHGQEEDEDDRNRKLSHWDGRVKLERCPCPSGERRGRLKGCMTEKVYMSWKCKNVVLINLEVFCVS